VLNNVNVGAYDWANMQFVVVAAGASTVLQFGFFSDTGFFGVDDVSVVPVPLPTVQSVERAGSAVNLQWATMPGLSYQVQYKTNLAATNWSDLGIPTNATGSTTSASDTLSLSALRFYRIALVP
jgi:hypothetical protein